MNANRADQADKTRIGLYRPLLFVFLFVCLVWFVVPLPKRVTTNHTKHTKTNTKQKTLALKSVLIRLIRPIRVQKNVR
ncbi:MAG: hypothetical protein DMF63_02120 [Acidobacteria bacterium]|nr:MAG: hypothetical protein DMF63_02120 [Acidobacteriota bacterium]